MSVREVSWECPSNIALVKYWGKHGVQLPCNPSLSLTLDAAKTVSHLRAEPKQGVFPEIEVYFKGERIQALETKMIGFFQTILGELPGIGTHKLVLRTDNTFPHGAGIASSASGMGALALCLCELFGTGEEADPSQASFWRKVSHISRLGSGSASRSVYPAFTVWGELDSLPGSSDNYAIEVNDRIHATFRSLRNCICIVDPAEKRVSSRAGHALMRNHPFASQRFVQARANIEELLDVLACGNMDRFIEIVETEALTLHAMMMTSSPSYLLMRPNTLKAIEILRDFRQQTGIPVCFTLDAGPNLHILYPENVEESVRLFIENQLLPTLEGAWCLWDKCGSGPKKLL
jgi:diphosphomevalonate decarboxylase